MQEQVHCILHKTRSSPTAEKQRVSCPRGGGRRLGPPARSPSAPLAIVHMVEAETRNKRTSSVLSTKRTLS